jgi:hypothetical protein
MLYIDTCVLLAVLTPEAHSATATAFSLRPVFHWRSAVGVSPSSIPPSA